MIEQDIDYEKPKPKKKATFKTAAELAVKKSTNRGPVVFQYNLMNPLFTFGQFEVRCQSLFIGWLQKQLALWNVSKQELNHCTQLVHGMPKSNGRGWSFSQGLHQVFMGFGVIQLNSYKWE